MAAVSCSLIITRFKAKLVTSSDPLSREMTEMTTLISIILGILLINLLPVKLGLKGLLARAESMLVT